jgi:hypothetical protein
MILACHSSLRYEGVSCLLLACHAGEITVLWSPHNGDRISMWYSYYPRARSAKLLWQLPDLIWNGGFFYTLPRGNWSWHAKCFFVVFLNCYIFSDILSLFYVSLCSFSLWHFHIKSLLYFQTLIPEAWLKKLLLLCYLTTSLPVFWLYGNDL